ncbi:MAG: diguanylate cyclase [Bacteroidota bacterium]
MKQNDKTNAELIMELQHSQFEYDLLKDLYTEQLNVGFQHSEKEKQAGAVFDISLLRQNAEAILLTKKTKKISILSEADILHLQHENEVYVIELELINQELLLQNDEKEKRADELALELAYQNSEKEDRAAELVLANIELTFQNSEKEIRATELVMANLELTYQNSEKEKRAVELAIADAELTFQNGEKEKRAQEYTKMSYLNNKFIGRELKMVELKKEINELLLLHGGEAKYDTFE